MEDIKDEQ